MQYFTLSEVSLCLCVSVRTHVLACVYICADVMLFMFIGTGACRSVVHHFEDARSGSQKK